jgi:hypothetical protein
MISIYSYSQCQSDSIHIALRSISNDRAIYKSIVKVKCDSPSPILSAFHSLDQAISFMTKEAHDNQFTIYVPDSIVLFAVQDDLDLDLPDFCQKVINRHQLLKNNFVYSIQYASPQFSPVMQCTKDMLGIPNPQGPSRKLQSYFGQRIGKAKADSYRKRYYKMN